ncbi:MAG: glycosyltransferase [candidate division TM6 bacterium GW2011_GWF2_36_6]|nr:MAG: glycosyltransferase [candidate division TM6 bacterium GW2011_GWF2_36_6]
MLQKKKPKIAILSLRNSYCYGGVLTSLKMLYEFCSRYFEPTVFFLGFDHEISTSLRHGTFSSSHRHVTYFGMNCVEVGARWAFWEPGHYAYTHKEWETLLAEFHYFVAVSGTCIAAHPLALLHKKYGLFIATPYQEDRSERVKQLSAPRKIIDMMAQKSMLAIEKNILEKAGYIWAMSSYCLEKFKRIAELDNRRLACCGFPLDCSTLPVLTHKKEKTIVALGRFSDPRKNLPMLMRVFDGIYKALGSAKLYVIGHRPSDEMLRPFMDMPSFKKIIFTGQVSTGDLAHVLSQSCLMLLTSYQEGFGIAGIEAMLHGTPVIATRCGGPEDFVIEGVTGYLVAINDDAAMQEKALVLLKDKNKRITMAYNAQRFVVEHYDIPLVYDAFKKGFVQMHPELQDWFNRCDSYYKKQSSCGAVFHGIKEKGRENTCC